MALETKRLVALVGPSGSGKTAILDFLASRYPDEFAVPRSVTSRPRRKGEGDEEYEFVSDQEFRGLVEAGELLEHSSYAGHMYGLRGSRVQEIVDQGKFPIRAMDFPGAVASGAYRIYVDRSTDALLEALLSRNLPDAEVVRRLRQIPKEKANRMGCDEAIANDAAICDAAFRIRGLLTGKHGRFTNGILVSTWMDGWTTETPCTVNLTNNQVTTGGVSPAPTKGLVGTMPKDEILRIGPREYDVMHSVGDLGPDTFFRIVEPTA